MGRHHILARRAAPRPRLTTRPVSPSTPDAAARRPTLQRDQPEGVPPLALTGERTLPDVPEENYWFRRHLVVYEWIAARVRGPARDRHGLRRGLRLGRARAHAPRASSASTPTPRPTSTRACATCAPNLRFARDLVDSFAEPADAVVFLQTIEHLAGPGRGARALPLAARRRRRRVRLDARTCSRSRPRAPSARTTRGTCTSTAPRSSSGSAARTSRRSRCTGCSTRASCARTSWRCGSAGIACTPGSASRERFYDWFTPAIAASRLRAARRPARPTSIARWTSSRCAGRERRTRRARRAGDRPAHAHALRRGLRHVAVRRGVAVGGDGQLLPAAAGPARRGRAADAVADAGAVRPARGARRRRALRGVRGRRARARPTREDAAGLRAGGQEALARELERSFGDYEGALERLRARGGDLLGALARHAPVDLLGDPRDAAAARHRRGRAAAGRSAASPPTAAASAASAGAAASGCPSARTRRGSTRALEDAGVRAVCVELTDRFGLGAPRHLRPLRHAPRACCSCRSTARRSSLVWSERRLSRRAAPTATTTTTPSTTTTRGATTAAPTTTPRAGAGARARRRLRRAHARAPARAAARRGPVAAGRRAGGVRAGHRAARPLVVRGHRLAAARWWRSARARAWSWCAWTMRSSAVEPRRRSTTGGAARRREHAGARAATCRRGRARRWPTWPSPRAPRSCEVVAAGERAGAAAVRELLALQASDWPFMVSRELAGPYPRERFEGHRQALARALAGGEDRPRGPAQPRRPRRPRLLLVPS